MLPVKESTVRRSDFRRGTKKVLFQTKTKNKKIRRDFPKKWKVSFSYVLYKGKNPKVALKEIMQHVSLSGRPYPNIVHNVQSPALK